MDLIDNRPTNNDLITTIKTLEYLLDYLNREEPYATSTIHAMEQVIDELPREIDEIEILT